MKDLIKRYLKIKIQAKTSLRKEIRRIDEVVQALALAQVEQNYLIEEIKKDSYKTKWKEEHKKFKEYEKESKAIIEELTETIKQLQKEVK
jgi:hypothetical protein